MEAFEQLDFSLGRSNSEALQTGGVVNPVCCGYYVFFAIFYLFCFSIGWLIGRSRQAWQNDLEIFPRWDLEIFP